MRVTDASTLRGRQANSGALSRTTEKSFTNITDDMKCAIVVLVLDNAQ